MTSDRYNNLNKSKLGLSVPLRKEWRTRGYIPHRDKNGLVQSITFRLADSLPVGLLEKLKLNLENEKEAARALKKRKLIEKYLDAGMGCCALAHPEVARVMEETLMKFDGDRYELIAWCVMPNHVHVLIKQEAALGKILQSWKSYTGRWAMSNHTKLGLGVPEGDRFWMREYWDRYIRDEEHFYRVANYIHNNPVKAGLCDDAGKWRWSSAWQERNGTPSPS